MNPPAQSRGGRLCSVLARGADRDGRQHDRQHHAGVEPLLGDARGDGREDEEQEQRTPQLVQDHTEPGQPLRLGQGVETKAPKARRGFA
jgi:hypothetical protein